MHEFTNQYSQFDLVQYYMEIFNIERGPDFYGNQCLNVLMPNEPENVSRFTEYMEMLGYETTSRVYWENIGITDKEKFIYQKRVQQIGGGFHVNFIADHVLLVTFNSINNPSN